MQALDKVKSESKPGEVYRREDLLDLSNAVDRHLKQLLEEEAVVKPAGRLYYCPKPSKFGTFSLWESILSFLQKADERVSAG